MSRLGKFSGLIALFGLGLGAVWAGALAASPSGASRPQETSSQLRAPDFELRGIDGKAYTLSAQRGKVVILNFWDTWCPPCKAEIPDFVELQKQYGRKGLQILGVAFARQGLDAVQSFVKSYKINYPVLLATPKVVEDYGGIEGIPTTFVIDQQGRIRQKYVGYRPREVWESVVRELLGK
ncbi:MAG: TlpA family protein disulfide reductase [candidate division KSB1 bacterium]|nr:TlpA family protein disulfide reductase [candidate division KSB1 bacterium]